MKQIKIVLSILYISICILLVSCSTEEALTNQKSTTNIISNSVNSDLLEQIDKLKEANKNLEKENNSLKDRIKNQEDIINENVSLKTKVEYLEICLDDTSVSPLSCNYDIERLLQRIYTEKSTLSIFPGILQSIQMEKTNGVIYFVFSIDRMIVNPNWDGPGSDGGRGYFINSEEKNEFYRGTLDTNFYYKGFESYQDKQEYVLNKYGNNDVYYFYMIDDEIVLVGPNTGP